MLQCFVFFSHFPPEHYCAVLCHNSLREDGSGSAYDKESMAIIKLNNTTVLYLKEVTKFLALVCILREESFERKGKLSGKICDAPELIWLNLANGDVASSQFSSTRLWIQNKHIKGEKNRDFAFNFHEIWDILEWLVKTVAEEDVSSSNNTASYTSYNAIQ